jgi:hypothetical protein
MGTSLSASPTLDIYAATYPPQMDPLQRVSVTVNGLDSSIELSWTSGQANGGLPIIGYYLQMNSGFGTPFTNNLYQTTGTQFTFTGLIAGATYEFRIAAYNLLEAQNKQADDTLNFSNAASYIIANAPDIITDLQQSTQNYEATKVKLTW